MSSLIILLLVCLTILQVTLTVTTTVTRKRTVTNTDSADSSQEDYDTDDSESEEDESHTRSIFHSSAVVYRHTTSRLPNQQLTLTAMIADRATRLYLPVHTTDLSNLHSSVSERQSSFSSTEDVQRLTIFTTATSSSRYIIHSSTPLLQPSQFTDIQSSTFGTSSDVTQSRAVHHQINEIQEYVSWTGSFANSRFSSTLNQTPFLEIYATHFLTTQPTDTIEHSYSASRSATHTTQLSQTFWGSEILLPGYTSSTTHPQEISLLYSSRESLHDATTTEVISIPSIPELNVPISTTELQRTATASPAELTVPISTTELQRTATASPAELTATSGSSDSVQTGLQPSHFPFLEGSYSLTSHAAVTEPSAAATEPSSAVIESSSAVSETSSAVSESSSAVSEPCSAVSEPSSAVIETSSAVSEPSYAVSEPSSAVSEPSSAVSEPSSAVIETSSAVSEPSYAVSEPSYAVSEPSSAVSEPSSAVSEPSSAAIIEPSSAAIIEPSSAVIEPSSAVIETSSAVIETSSAVIEPSYAVIEPSSAVIVPRSATTEPSSAIIEPSSAATEPSPAVIEPRSEATEPSSAVSEPSTAVSETSSAITEPSAAVIEPSSAAIIEPSSAVIEPSSAATEPSSAITEPSSAATEPSAAVIAPSSAAIVEPSSAVTEPSSAATEPSSTATEPSSAVTEPSSAVTEPSAAVTEPSSAVIEPSSAVIDSQNLEHTVSSESMYQSIDQRSNANIMTPSTDTFLTLPLTQTTDTETVNAFSDFWNSITQHSEATLTYIPLEISMTYVPVSSTLSVWVIYSPVAAQTDPADASNTLTILSNSTAAELFSSSPPSSSLVDSQTQTTDLLPTILVSDCQDCSSYDTSRTSLLEAHVSAGSVAHSSAVPDLTNLTESIIHLFSTSLSFVSSGIQTQPSLTEFHIFSQSVDLSTPLLYNLTSLEFTTHLLSSSSGVYIPPVEHGVATTSVHDTPQTVEGLSTSAYYTELPEETFSSHIYTLLPTAPSSSEYLDQKLISYQTESSSHISVHGASSTDTGSPGSDVVSSREISLDTSGMTTESSLHAEDVTQVIDTSFTLADITAQITTSDLQQSTTLQSGHVSMTSFLTPHVDISQVYSTHVTSFLETSELSQSSSLVFTASTTTTHTITTTTSTIPIFSNFTIFITFDGDCRKAVQKRYTGILNAKILQLFMNISFVEDKNSIAVGALQCSPNRIPVAFVRADKRFVLLHFKDMFSTEYPSRYIKIHSIILNLTGYEEMIDIPKKRFAVEVTPVDITVIAVASCLCLILLIAGGFVFAREMYHKKMSKRFTSTRVALRTETVALTSIPAHSIAYGDVDMNEEHCVNPGYTHSLHDDDSSVTAEHKTTFPSSEQSAPGVNVRDKTSIKHKDYKSTHVTKASSTSTPSQRHGTNKDESPGYGLVIGLMGYTKRLERQQQLNQQQKQQFEENSYYAVPHKRAKTGKLQDFPDTAIPLRSSQLTSSHSPPESTIVEDSFISSPRHLRTLPTTNGVSDSNEELLSPGSRTKRGVDNPYVSEHTGKADEAQVFHF